MAKTLLQLAGATPVPSRLGQSTLVLIDIQNEYFDGPLKLAGVEAAAEVAAGLLARARALGAPVVHVRQRGRAGAEPSIRMPRAGRFTPPSRRWTAKPSSTRACPTVSPTPRWPRRWRVSARVPSWWRVS